MLIDALIKELQGIRDKHGNITVKCTWEGTMSDIEGIYLTKDYNECDELVLLIDSDECFYKKRYEYTGV